MSKPDSCNQGLIHGCYEQRQRLGEAFEQHLVGGVYGQEAHPGHVLTATTSRGPSAALSDVSVSGPHEMPRAPSRSRANCPTAATYSSGQPAAGHPCVA